MIKHIEEGLDHKNLREVTTKYNSNHRKHKYELVKEPKKQVNITFIDKKLAFKVIWVVEQHQHINLEQY